MENIKINPPIQNPPDKTCRKCGVAKPATLEFFYKNAGGKYGVTPRCKPCVNEDNNKWASDNPERARASANARSKKYYHSDLERGRRVARESAAKARKDQDKYAKIQARKRGGQRGLTLEQIEAIRTSQSNLCAICGDPDPTDLDHCHKSGQVRWLLCRHCNRGLGAFRDNTEWLRKAADMLEAKHG